MKGNIDVYRDEYEIFCVVNSCSKDDVLLNEEHIREMCLEEAKTEREKDIVLNSNFIIIPRDEGGFYVEFVDFK